MSLKISVITICYNAAPILPLTIESVLAQDYDDFEYVIQDGMSADETPKIIEGYRQRFEDRNIRFIYNREPDNGIYDAMNKGVASAEGDYINFMNAGDCFYSADVIRKVAGAIEQNTEASDDPSKPAANPAIVYGDCAVYEYGRFYRYNKSLDSIEEMMPFSHQSVFAVRDLLLEHPFDTGNRYSSDYDFLLTAHDLGVRFLDSGVWVCITTADGTSSVNYHDTLMESVAILKKHGLYHHSEAELARNEKMLKIKQFVLDNFPVPVRKWIRGRQIKERGQDISPDIPDWFSDHYLINR